MWLWFRNVRQTLTTLGVGLYRTLWYFTQTFRRRTFAERFEYPERPLAVKPRYRGFHRFDLTECIGCDKCARACPVDCIYIDKVKNPAGKGFRVEGFTIDYTKCMLCGLCVDPCPTDCLFMGSSHDLSTYSRDGCVVDFARIPLPMAWGPASLTPTVVAESKTVTEPVWEKPAEVPVPLREGA